MSIKTFAILTFLGLSILVPVKTLTAHPRLGKNSTDIMFPSSQDGSVPLSPTFLTGKKHDNNTSPLLLTYLASSYLFSFVAMWFMFCNYRDYIRSRRRYLLARATTFTARTVMVSGVPT